MFHVERCAVSCALVVLTCFTWNTMLKNHKRCDADTLLNNPKREKKFGTVFVGQNTKNLLTLFNAHTCTFLSEKHYICTVIDN